MDYVEARLNGDIYYLIAARVDAVLPINAERLGTVKGRELLDLTYDGPYSDLPAQRMSIAALSPGTRSPPRKGRASSTLPLGAARRILN